MKCKTILLAVLSAYSSIVVSQPLTNWSFVSPIGGEPSLSASFAELRADHFHSGLDYRTGGVQGREILAVDEGSVYRIGVSPTGFGKVLYIRHASGFSSVYAHLRSFRPDIEEYVKQNQYEKRSFTISLFPAAGRFRVSRGEVIAWSGNSGGSTGPHLHFELRDSATEEPVNPLLFDNNVSDKTRPLIDKVVLYPLTPASSVNNLHRAVTLKARPQGLSYGVSATTAPVVYGETGIGIKCWDTFDNSSNRCGVYSIELMADEQLVYRFTADRFSYNETRFINAHIDYAARSANGENIQQLFILPGDRLSMHRAFKNRGVLMFGDDREHDIKIIVTDTHGNSSHITFRLRSVSEPPVAPADLTFKKMMPWQAASDYTADGIRVHLPAGTLYDTLWFRHSVRSGNGKLLSSIHSVHDETVPAHGRFTLSLRPDTVFPGLTDKLCLALINNKGAASYSGGSFRYGFVNGEVNRFGNYAVAIDTVAPTVNYSFTPGADLTGRSLFTVTIRDDFSGIASYEMIIDNQWALAEYDPKYNHLVYRPDGDRIKENTLHTIEVRVTDNRGNRAVVKSQFKW